MSFINIITYLADIMYLIDRSTDIVIMGMIFSAMIVGFLYAIMRLTLEKSLSFLPFF